MAIIEAAAREDMASGNIKLGEPQSPSYTAKRPRPKTKKS
jgi:hypothetical protein